MGVIVFADETVAWSVLSEIHCTPCIEGGAGPVKLGVPARGGDGRWLVSHCFREVDLDWLEAYTAGITAEIRKDIPPDWQSV